MKHELVLFFRSVIYGVGLLFVYDQIRSLRKVWKHGKVLTFVEDSIFWCMVSIFLFSRLYVFNAGIPRWYFFVGVCGGMVAYYESMSAYVVNFEAFLLKRLKMLIAWGKIFMKRVISSVFKALGMYHGKRNKERNKETKKKNAKTYGKPPE